MKHMFYIYHKWTKNNWKTRSWMKDANVGNIWENRWYSKKKFCTAVIGHVERKIINKILRPVGSIYHFKRPIFHEFRFFLSFKLNLFIIFNDSFLFFKLINAISFFIHSLFICEQIEIISFWNNFFCIWMRSL